MSLPSVDLLKKRDLFLRKVRYYFYNRDFIEADTPCLRETPCMEAYLDPYEVRLEENKKGFLSTSPEFALKELLGLGAEKIFEIAHAFRSAEKGKLHRREFLMLEWYESGTTMGEMMERTKDLILHIFNRAIPFHYLSVNELIQEKAGCKTDYDSLLKECKDRGMTLPDRPEYEDLFYRIFLPIEEEFKRKGGVFLHSFPPELCAYAVIQDGVAKRFEFYLNGVELANAYEEESDPQELQRRCQLLQDQIKRLGKDDRILDDTFINALAKVPKPISGIALGLDRLFALSLGLDNLEKCTPYPASFKNTP